MVVHIVHKYQFYGIPLTFINSIYNYYQLLDVLFVVGCAYIEFQHNVLQITHLKVGNYYKYYQWKQMGSHKIDIYVIYAPPFLLIKPSTWLCLENRRQD